MEEEEVEEGGGDAAAVFLASFFRAIISRRVSRAKHRVTAPLDCVVRLDTVQGLTGIKQWRRPPTTARQRESNLIGSHYREVVGREC